MAKYKSIKCPDCHQPMEMVELQNVPGDEIRNFIDIPGNKLDDNWYWCPKCDFYKQETPPIKLSADITKLAKLLEAFPSNL